MKIKSFIGGYDKNFSYLVWCNESKNAIIIDPAVHPKKIVNTIKSNDLRLTKILITHTHYDHIFFIDDWLTINPILEIIGYNVSKINYKNKKNILDQEIINLGNESLKGIYTPGHYPDSICYWSMKNSCIFTGDTMFVGRTGRVISNGSNISKLYNSIYNILLKLPKNTTIYSGHDYGNTKTTTIQESVKNYIFFQCESEIDFISTMKNYEKNRLNNK